MAERGPKDDFQPSLRINWNRPNIVSEENQNNMLGINQALGGLVHSRHYEEDHARPMQHFVDDMDSGSVLQVPMDKEWRNMVLTGIVFEQRRLKKHGIVFPSNDI